MMKLKYKISAICFSILLLPLTGLADSFFVEPVTGSGLKDTELTVARDLVKIAVTEVDASNEAIEDENKADFILRPKLIHLGNSLILSLVKLKDGKTLQSSQLKAETIDELDKVAIRLARVVISSKKSARLGEITNHEALDGTQRKAVRNEYYIGVGASSFSNLGSTGLGYSFNLARAWDFNTALLNIFAEANINGSAFFGEFGLGGRVFFTQTEIAPYLSADLGAGVSKTDGGSYIDGQTVAGFVIGGGIGMQMLRTSAVNLDVSLHGEVLVNSNRQGNPGAYTLRLGIYF